MGVTGRLGRNWRLFCLLAVFAPLSASADPLKIRVGWSTMPGHMIPVLFINPAILKHYGQSYTVEPISFRGSSPQITAMAAREVDLVAFSPATLALTVLNAHIDTKVVADIVQDGIGTNHSEAFMVRADSGITTVDDLRGKRIGTNAVGSAADTEMRAMMKKHGMSDPRDFTTIEAAFPSLPALLEAKKVDMAVILQPRSRDMEASGQFHTLFSGKDAWGPAQIVFLAGRAEFLDKNRAAMDDFMEDYVRALRWFENPANHAAAVAVVAKFMRVPDADLGYVFTSEDYFRDPFARPNIPALQNAIDVSKELGVIPNAIQVAPKYVDYSFVDEARRRIEAAP